MFGNRSKKFLVLPFVLLVVLVLVGTVFAAGTRPNVTNVNWFEDGTPVQGAKSQLLRTDDSVQFHINTKGLEVGHIYTVWSVTFNESQNCSDGVCGEDDIFNAVPPDGPGGLNVPGINASDISVVYAGGFQVNNNAGVGNVVGTVDEGLPGGGGQAHGAPFSQTGLGDALASEIHLVVRDHGPAQDDLEYAQMSTFGGGCDNVPAGHPGYTPDVDGDFTCYDAQFAIHIP